MLSNDDDTSNQSEPDSKSLEQCPHSGKKFVDLHVWNKFNKCRKAHFK
jgi:hypothetical protein